MLTQIYRPIRKFLTGESLLAQWHGVIADAEKKFEAHGKLLADISEDAPSEVESATRAFFSNPCEKTLSACIDAEARREARAKVYSSLGTHVSEKKKALIESHRELLILAIEEVRSAFVKARADVVASDKIRSEETGIQEISTRTLSELDRRIDQLGMALMYANDQGFLSSARGMLGDAAEMGGV